jgi:formylglycine-generating enzyme required for sulfatase activity
MLLIPGGTFTMGSSDTDARNDETPHRAEVGTFCMDPIEVTVQMYAAHASGSAVNPDFWCNWGKTGRENHPINCVNWDEATKYCEAVGKRLPTEQEWEYAARGGAEQRKYPWGPEAPSSSNACWEHGDGTCGVESYPAGAFGLYDIAGNVWEWVQDWYGPYPTSVSKNYAGPPGGSDRVKRGGSWFIGIASTLRGSIRGYFTPTDRDFNLGFRCARTLME